MPTCADDDTTRRFEFYDVHHALKGELVEVEPIAHVVVGRHRLGIVVDHHAAQSLLTNGVESLHTAPVELHAATDTIGTTAENDDAASVALVAHIVRRAAVCEVEVIGFGGILCGQRVDAFDNGQNAALLAHLSDKLARLLCPYL